jgi:hypothetical protein
MDVAGGQEMIGDNGTGVMAEEFERGKKNRKGRILRV